MNATVRTLLIATVAAGVAVAPAAGAATKKPPKKPITKTYTATAPAPDPTNWVEPRPYELCAQRVPNSFHIERFRVPAAGRLQVELTNYQGDWDALLMDDDNDTITLSGSTELNVREKMEAKFKKATNVSIVVCNWVGGPEGTVKYTFTYAPPA